MKKIKINLWTWPFQATVFFALIYKAIYFINGESMPRVDKISLFSDLDGVFSFLSFEVFLPFSISRLWDILIFFFFVFLVLKMITFANKDLTKKKKRVSFGIKSGLLLGTFFLLLLSSLGLFFNLGTILLISLLFVLFLVLRFLFLLKSLYAMFRATTWFSLSFSFMLLPFFAYHFSLGFVLGIIASMLTFILISLFAFLAIITKKTIMLFKK